MSLLIVAVGVVVLFLSLDNDLSSLTTAVALLLTGGALVYISIVRANKKLILIQTGYMAKGTYKEWKKSYITYNENNLVYLVYSYVDRSKKKRNVYVLSSSTDAMDEVTVFYNEDDSVVLEYLPGRPHFKDNEIKG
ncbi:hypothetical protein [Cohnella sp. GCM10012308]|uniref:hypothetical protein n=1 Tax=Cohnella sp. GCM10012308 TaxID=3317329 RepID=UPI00360D047D